MRMPCRACFMPEDAWNIYSRYSFSTALWAPGNEKRATEKTNSRLNITILWYPLAALKTYFAYVFQTEMMISQDFTKRDTDVRWCQDAPESMKYPLRHISYKRIFKKLKTLEDRYPFVGRSTAWAHPGPESCHHLEPESGVIPEAFTGYKGLYDQDFEERYPLFDISTAWRHSGPESCHHSGPESGEIPGTFTRV